MDTRIGRDGFAAGSTAGPARDEVVRAQGPLPEAWLLLGPTGAGKTPLGRLLERGGIAGRHCVHFDFGECLRRLAAGDRMPAGMMPRDREIAARVLRERALLADSEFGTAGRLFTAFLRERRVSGGDVVVLNGLPRHVGQAEAVGRLARVTAVVFLNCPASVAAERVRLNSGGDRGGRRDDAPEDVAAKLAEFERRTLPLREWYRGHGARMVDLRVGVGTTDANLLAELEKSA